MSIKTSRTYPVWVACLLAAAAIIGCGDSDSNSASEGESGRGSVVTENGDGSSSPDRDVKPFTESDELQATDVKRLVSYYQEGGPPGCDNEDYDSPVLALSYGIDALPREEEALELRIGDNLWICVLGVQELERVRIEIEAPGQNPEPLRIDNETGASIVYGSVPLLPENRSGRWRLTAQADGQDAEMSLRVLPPASPGYRRIETHPDGTVDFLVVGLQAGQRFSLHVYEPLDFPSEGSEELPKAEYLATVEAEADQAGQRIVTLDSEGAKEKCYLAKLEVDGRFLDDRHNELSVFCPTLEVES